MSRTAIATQWGIDTAHSEIQFKVRHIMISTVTGNFNNFEGSLKPLETLVLSDFLV